MYLLYLGLGPVEPLRPSEMQRYENVKERGGKSCVWLAHATHPFGGPATPFVLSECWTDALKIVKSLIRKALLHYRSLKAGSRNRLLSSSRWTPIIYILAGACNFLFRNHAI